MAVECLVQQRLLQGIQRRLLLCAEDFEALGFGRKGINLLSNPLLLNQGRNRNCNSLHLAHINL